MNAPATRSQEPETHRRFMARSYHRNMARMTLKGTMATIAVFLTLLIVVVLGAKPSNDRIAPLILLASVVVAVCALGVRHRDKTVFERQLRLQAAADAVRDDRLMLTEHLHDLVSHRLAAITLQASSCLLIDGSDTRAALKAIEADSRAATQEMRTLLTALRQSHREMPSPPRSLRDVCTQAQAAGLEVITTQTTFFHHQEVENLLASVVQEALANVARHAGRTRVHVHVSRKRDSIHPIVRNEAPMQKWKGSPGSGIGLALLQKRCASLGGRVEAGHRPDGFCVDVLLPDPEGNR